MSKLQQVCEEEMKWRVEYIIRLKTGEITFCPLTPLMPFFPAVPCRKTNKQTNKCVMMMVKEEAVIIVRRRWLILRVI